MEVRPADPTYDRGDIDDNPEWHLAFVLSEHFNDNAPIGWSRYVPMAAFMIKAQVNAATKATQELRADLAAWQHESLAVAVAMLTSERASKAMRPFIEHHERLIAILAKHKLVSAPSDGSPAAEVASAVSSINDRSPDPRD